MPYKVYDYRKDIVNMLVTPQIRCRFLKMEVGQFNQGHTHDLGHEIFLILQGQAEFNIDGHKEVLGPGQMCIALTDENHTVENVGDDEVIMFLSVTPHIQPTHTYWNEDGTKKPPRFTPLSNYDLEDDHDTPTETLLDRHLEAAESFAAAVEAGTNVQRDQVAAFRQALSNGDKEAALKARDTMWEAMYTMYQSIFELGDVWNDFTARTTDSEF